MLLPNVIAAMVGGTSEEFLSIRMSLTRALSKNFDIICAIHPFNLPWSSRGCCGAPVGSRFGKSISNSEPTSNRRTCHDCPARGISGGVYYPRIDARKRSREARGWIDVRCWRRSCGPSPLGSTKFTGSFCT